MKFFNFRKSTESRIEVLGRELNRLNNRLCKIETQNTCSHKHTEFKMREVCLNSESLYKEVCLNCGKVIKNFKNENEFEQAKLNRSIRRINELKKKEK